MGVHAIRAGLGTFGTAFPVWTVVTLPFPCATTITRVLPTVISDCRIQLEPDISYSASLDESAPLSKLSF